MENKKYLYRNIILGVLVIIILVVGVYFYLKYKDIGILSVNLDGYNGESKLATITIKTNRNKLKYTCVLEGSEKTYEIKNDGSKCKLEVPLEDEYKVYLKYENKTTTKEALDKYIDSLISFNFNKDKIYIVKGEETTIPYSSVSFKNDEYKFEVDNENIIKIEDNKIIALDNGEATLKIKGKDQELKVIVTDLITKPYAIKDKKTLLSCGVYNDEQNKQLDEILEYKVNEGGYQTRGGAVAAARFLTLEFAYRVPYYYETGRIPLKRDDCKYNGKFGYTNINTNLADGEGRYYRKGLYLTEAKKEDIKYSVKGPATWGCNLMNIENKPEYGFRPGAKVPNGLDCSGFVTWSLVQAGFDPGDVGAGEDPGRDCQCTDLGKFVTLSDHIDTMKPGDLLNWWGHIAMFIGVDRKTDTYYVAESLSYIGGVRAMIYTRKELINTFKYTVQMDSFYKEEGNYTEYWA